MNTDDINVPLNGAIESTSDIRDYRYSDIAHASIPYDWMFDFDIEEKVGTLPVKDQAQTSACGGFAWASLSYVLDESNREEKSEKFIYAQTHVPGGGSGGRTNSALCVKKGVCKKELCPLPVPLTEDLITVNDISPEAFADALTNKEKSYFQVEPNIDVVAQAIRDNHGVILLIRAQNNGSWRTKFPLPPTNNQGLWAHWVYAGKVKNIAGKKYIGFLNSWGKDIGDGGWQYISEDYFKSVYIAEVWTMMYDSQIASKFIFTKTLRKGMSGLDVKMLQTKLNIPADGKFGSQTEGRVKEFQSMNHLQSDGIVGPLTNKVLNML